MRYRQVIKGKFLSRPNRFLAKVEINGREEIVHVKNTGRLKELLLPACEVILGVSDKENRKTKYDLIAVRKEDGSLVNIDSQIPNAVVAEWLEAGTLFSAQATIRREVTYGASRFDLFVEDDARKAFLEVKGVTLLKDGVARFPDAPTERGIKHLSELCAAVRDGYEAYAVFVIQMKGACAFSPNEAMHPAFAEALRKAKNEGVHILAYDCIVREDEINIDRPVKILI